MTSVTVNRDHYTTVIQSRKHTYKGDEPVSAGGKDLGPTATEMLEGSLGNCTAITLRMYADRKKWALDEVRITLDLKQETECGVTSTLITKNIELLGNLFNEQKERLMVIADKCPIHKVLTSNVQITSSY